MPGASLPRPSRLLALRLSGRCAPLLLQAKGSVPYFETSAKEAINVEQAFQIIARNALKQDSEEDIYLPDTIDVTEQKMAGPSSCNC